MSDREKLPEWIDRFNNGELSGKELTSFLEMVQRDPRLSEEIRLDKELDSILKDEDLLEVRAKIRDISSRNLKRRGSRRKFYLMAASFLILIGAGTLAYFISELKSKLEIGDEKGPGTEEKKCDEK